MKARTSAWLVAALLVAGSARAGADVVTMSNGDRLSGAAVKMVQGVLTFSTPYAGEVHLDWTKVTHLQLDKALPAVLADGSTREPTELPAENLRLADVVALAPPPPPRPAPPPVRWKGRADLGYNLTQGNANTQLGTFTLFAERKRPGARHFSFLFDAARGRSSGVETVDRARVETKLDRTTVGESYRYWLLGAGYDRVRDSDLRLEAGSGFGRTLINTASNHLSAEIGASCVRERFSRTGTETAAKLRFGETWERPLSRRVGLSHSLALLSVVGNYRDYTALSVFAVTLQVSQKVSLVSRLTNNYDSRPAPGTKRSDLLLTSQLGFAFGP